MIAPEVNQQLQDSVRSKAAASANHAGLHTVMEEINRSQPPAFAEMVRRVNRDRKLSARLNRLILDSTIHLPAHWAAFIAKRSSPRKDSTLPVRP